MPQGHCWVYTCTNVCYTECVDWLVMSAQVTTQSHSQTLLEHEGGLGTRLVTTREGTSVPASLHCSQIWSVTIWITSCTPSSCGGVLYQVLVQTLFLVHWRCDLGNHVTVRFGATKAVKNIPQCVCSYLHLLLHIKYLKSCTTIGSCDSLCIYCWVWHLNSIHCYLKLNYS